MHYHIGTNVPGCLPTSLDDGYFEDTSSAWTAVHTDLANDREEAFATIPDATVRSKSDFVFMVALTAVKVRADEGKGPAEMLVNGIVYWVSECPHDDLCESL